MSNINVNISNRLLTYVKHGVDITPGMKDIYSNSLILIGDEKQIYVPVLNAYVGIGESRFSEIEDLVKRMADANFKDTIEIEQLAQRSTNYFTYALYGINSVQSGSNSAFRIAYQTIGLPTKLYVDESIANAAIDLHGYRDTNDDIVITNTYLTNDGDIAYTYSNLTATYSGSKSVLTPEVETDNQLTNITNPDNLHKGINVVTGIKATQNGLQTEVSYTYTTIYATKDHHSNSGNTTGSDHAIINVHLSTGGELSYSTADLSGNWSLQNNAFITYIVQNKYGKITSISGNHFDNDTVELTAGKLSTDPAAKQRIVTNTYISLDGKLTTTYKDIYADPTDFTYHHLELAQISPVQNTTLFTYALVGISTTNNDTNANKHVISYQTLGLPTKKYVDDTVAANKLNLSNTGVENTNSSVVITNTYLSATGQYSYTYSSLSASSTGSEIILTPTSKTTLANILNPASLSKGIDVITGITVTTDKLETKITYTYASIYASMDHHSTEVSHGINASSNLISNVHLSESGELSYTFVSLQGSGSKPKGFLRGFTQDSLGKITVSGKEFANTHTRSDAHKVATSATSANQYVSYTYLTEDGELKVSYTYLYVDPENDFKYHEFGVTQEAAIGDNNFVYLVNGINTTNSGNNTSHTLSYHLVGVPTKKYVDDLIEANDAMRYRGTVTPASSTTGNITLTYDTTKYSSPDTSVGAVYKVSGSGYIGSTYVSAGDMIISYLDNAASNNATGWNVINENIDLRTGTPTSAENSQGTKRVLTNVSLSNSGTLSYTYAELAVSTNKPNPINIGGIRIKQSVSENYNINTSNTNQGFPVITYVSLSQDGITTYLTYSYSYIYAGVSHHSTAAAVDSGNNIHLTYENTQNLVTAVSLSSTGELQYTYSKVNVETAYQATYSTYSTYSVGLDSIKRDGDTTSGVLTNIYIDSDKKLTVSYTSLSSGSDNNAGFIKYYTQAANGKVSAVTGNFSNNKRIGTKYLSDTSYDFITYVSLDNTGKLTYDLITVTLTDSYTYNKELTANGTIINITGTTSLDGSRTWSYITPDHFYTYIHGTTTYTFMQNAEIGRNLLVNYDTFTYGSLLVKNNVELGTNATTTYTKIHGRAIVEQDFYTYGTNYLGNGTSDNTTVSGNLSVGGSASITNNITVNGNATFGDSASDITTVTGDLKVKGNTYIGDAAADVTYINSRKINLENNATTLEFIGLKAFWGTIS